MSCADLQEGYGPPTPEKYTDLLNSHLKIPKIGLGLPQKTKISFGHPLPAPEKKSGSAPVQYEYQFNIHI